MSSGLKIVNLTDGKFSFLNVHFNFSFGSNPITSFSKDGKKVYLLFRDFFDRKIKIIEINFDKMLNGIIGIPGENYIDNAKEIKLI